MDKDMDAIAGKARWAIVARRALLGAIILVMASQTAFAAPTTLVCRRSNNGSLGLDVFTLNEVQRTATIAFAAIRNDDGSVGPPRSSGPLSATFTPDTITISEDHVDFVSTYVINRVAATVGLTQVANNQVVGHAEWTCHVGKKQF
jgi:hypothetical protein